MIQNLNDFISNIKTWEVIFIGVFLLVFLIRLLYDFIFTGKAAFYKNRKNGSPDSSEPLSLLMTVRNEEDNLKNNLPVILAQVSGLSEVIVVDDFSQDLSFTVLGILREKYSNLKFSSLNQEIRYSAKVSQNVALKAATSEWVIFLSPVVKVLPDDWIKLFRESLDESKNIVISYTNINPGKGFYHLLYRIECYFQQLRSYAFLLNGFGFVVKEENIAFRKSNYFIIGGYGKKINEAYANLELIINDFIKKKTTTLLLNPDSVIRKSVGINKNDYWELLEKYRRIRSYLPFYKRFALWADDFLRIFWPLMALGTFVYFGTIRIFIAAIVFIKFLVRALILKASQKHLHERKIFLSSLVYEGLMPFVTLFSNKRPFRMEKKRKWRS